MHYTEARIAHDETRHTGAVDSEVDPVRAEASTHLVDEAIDLVGQWVHRASKTTTASDRKTGKRLHGVIADADGVEFAMRFVDR